MNFLFVSVVQNLVELLQLPGLEEDRAFQKEIGLKTLVYKAYRYVSLGARLSSYPVVPEALGACPVPWKTESLPLVPLPVSTEQPAQRVRGEETSSCAWELPVILVGSRRGRGSRRARALNVFSLHFTPSSRWKTHRRWKRC